MTIPDDGSEQETAPTSSSAVVFGLHSTTLHWQHPAQQCLREATDLQLFQFSSAEGLVVFKEQSVLLRSLVFTKLRVLYQVLRHLQYATKEFAEYDSRFSFHTKCAAEGFGFISATVMLERPRLPL